MEVRRDRPHFFDERSEKLLAMRDKCKVTGILDDDQLLPFQRTLLGLALGV
jgi:hypothetical protein